VYIDRAAYDAPGGKAPLLRQIGNLPPAPDASATGLDD